MPTYEFVPVNIYVKESKKKKNEICHSRSYKWLIWVTKSISRIISKWICSLAILFYFIFDFKEFWSFLGIFFVCLCCCRQMAIIVELRRYKSEYFCELCNRCWFVIGDNYRLIRPCDGCKRFYRPHSWVHLPTIELTYLQKKTRHFINCLLYIFSILFTDDVKKAKMSKIEQKKMNQSVGCDL